MDFLLAVGFIIFFIVLYKINNRPHNVSNNYRSDNENRTQSYQSFDSQRTQRNKNLPFYPNKKVGGLSADGRNNTFKIKGSPMKIFEFEDVISYELIEDGQSIVSGGMSLGKALVGGVLAGGVGAIIGGTTGKRKDKSIVNSMIINLTMRGQYSGRYEIPIITSKVKRNSKDYQKAVNEARDIISVFDIKLDALSH